MHAVVLHGIQVITYNAIMLHTYKKLGVEWKQIYNYMRITDASQRAAVLECAL